MPFDSQDSANSSDSQMGFVNLAWRRWRWRKQVFAATVVIGYQFAVFSSTHKEHLWRLREQPLAIFSPYSSFVSLYVGQVTIVEGGIVVGVVVGVGYGFVGQV